MWAAIGILAFGVAGFVAGFFVCKNNYGSVEKVQAKLDELTAVAKK